MEAPNVSNLVLSPEKNIQFNVIAYRKLTEEELRFWIRLGISQLKKPPKNNSKYTFVAIDGRRD